MASEFVLVQTVYHHPAGEDPLNVDHRYAVPLTSDEQAYVRKLPVGETWTKLDLGWLASKPIKQICIASEVGKGLQVIPTPGEQEAINATIIEIGANEEAQWQIAPKETFRGQPADASKLMLRCRRGTGVVTIVIIPA